MPGAIGNAFSVGATLSQYLSDQFEGICLLVKAQMKMKGDTAFKVIFDELMKNPLTGMGALASISLVFTKTLNLGSSAASQISAVAMEICDRGGFVMGSDDGPGGAPAGRAAGRAAIDRAAAASPVYADDAGDESGEEGPPPPQPPARSGRRGGSSKRTMYRKKSTGKKSMMGGRRRSAAKSKKNKGKH
jgi:hypothetical protein